MADRYWRGGTANWDGTAGSKWAATAGGPTGASVPTTADDVFFDATSSGTCTIASGNTGAKSINCTGFTGTIAGTSNITVAGSVTLDAGMTYTHTGTMTLSGTGTLTTAGKAFSGVTVNGSGITVTLGDALNISTRSITLTQGAFDAANYNLTCTGFASSNTNTRTLTMGSGLWTLSGTGNVWVTNITNLTFNKDTADILLSNTTTTARTFAGGGLTFNKLTIGGATGTSTTSFAGANTFSELASTKTVAHTIRLNLAANGMTVGVWSVTGTSGNVVTVDSNVAGTQRNFNLTNVTSGIDYLSVKDIAVNQANRFYVGANSTDGGNNSNVIFTAAPSTQTLTPSLFTNTSTFYAATVTASNQLNPARYDNINVFYAPTVAASNALAPTRYDNTNAFYSPIVTIAGGAQTLLPPFYINTNIFYSATVSQPGVQLVGGGGGEDSSSTKAKRTKRKKTGFANERAMLEAALLAKQVAKNVDVLNTSSLAVAKKTARTLDAYLNEKGTSDALQRQLDKLLIQLSVQGSNDQNYNSLNEDLKVAANEIQQFLDDEQEAIEILLLDQENDNALLLMAMGF